MKLYLHIGTEKTGSSFLQSLLFYNKDYLQNQKGLYFPSHMHQDKRMRKGIVSAGNGLFLYECFYNQKMSKASKFIREEATKAKQLSCDKLVISNENLFRVLDDQAFIMLEEELISSNSLISEINIVLYVREFSEHILSMYKHRNKSGHYASFQNWLNNYYTTLNVLQNYANIFKKFDKIRSHHIFYRKDGKYMKQSFFKDFLNIDFDNLKEIDRVNESLSLSEIGFLQSTYQENKIAAEQLSKSFQKLKFKYKAKDTASLQLFHKHHAITFVKKHRSSIDSVIQDLGLSILFKEINKKLNPVIEVQSADELSLSFNQKQIKLINKVLKEQYSGTAKRIGFRRRWVKLIPKPLLRVYKYYRI